MAGTEVDAAARPVQAWLRDIPFRLRRELASFIAQEAESLASAIKARAPRRTGALANSVKVRRTRRALELEVTAGGPDTTKQLGRSVGYDREIAVGQGSDTRGAGRGSQGVTYDYAIGTEFGNEHAPAQPFFYATAREREADYRERLSAKLEEILSKA